MRVLIALMTNGATQASKSGSCSTNVTFGLPHLRLVRPGPQRIRVGEFLAQARVRGHFLEQVEYRGDRAARCRAAHGLHPHLHGGARHAVAAPRFRLQEVHPEVRGNRVEAAAMHDARARSPSRRFVSLDHAADPLDFARKVAVVGSGLGAGLHQRFAVERVWAHRRDDDPCLGSEFAQLDEVRRVGGQQFELTRAAAEFLAHRLELRPRSAGRGPAQIAREPERLEQVTREDLADEARGPEDDDVEWPADVFMGGILDQCLSSALGRPC